MTILDSSAAVDYLVGTGVAGQVRDLLAREAPLAAPDLLVFEVIAVVRRYALAGALSAERAEGAIDDLGAISIKLFPSMPLRRRAWEMRRHFTAADALFAALAEQLGEPLATKDRALVAALGEHTEVRVLALDDPR